MNLWLLDISKRSRHRWGRRVGVLHDFDVESVGDDALGRAKRANDNGRMDGFGGREEWGGNVLLGL